MSTLSVETTKVWDPNPIMRALKVCMAAHSGQKRKYSEEPYHVHPARVALKVQYLPGADEDMVVAAYLHDVLEDTQWTAEDLRRCWFSPAAVAMVIALTNQSKGVKAPRAERKRMDREYLRTCTRPVKIIKLCDRIDNLRDTIMCPDEAFRKMYAEESALLADAVGDASSNLKAELLTCVEELRAV